MSFIKKLINKAKEMFNSEGLDSINEDYSLNNMESTGEKVCANTARLDFQDYIKENITDSLGRSDSHALQENDFEVLKSNIKEKSKELSGLSCFKEYGSKLLEISEEASRPLLVMIMGEFKTGKSTFINAILEEEVLKSEVTPATAVVSMISYGKEKKVLAHFRDGSIKEFSFDELQDITAEGDKTKKELRSNIEYVELFMPKDILRGITLIDTPGLNVDNELHINATKEFMNKADMVFWVFACGKAASRTELSAIGELSKRLKPIAIVNKIDEVEEEEESLEEIIKDIEKRLKGSVDDIIGVSASLALKGLLKSNEKALIESRWTCFTNKLEKEVLEKSEALKTESVLDKLREYIEDLTQFTKITNHELKNMAKKFTNKTEYIKGVLKNIQDFKLILNKCIEVRSNKERVTIDRDYLCKCWEENNKSQLDKVESPLNFINNSISVLKIFNGTEKMISNIESYNDIHNNIINEINKISIKKEQLNKIDEQLTSEAYDYESQVDSYNTSGIFGGAPLLDWNGKKAKLDNWREDIINRNDELVRNYQVCRNNILSQFSRTTRMNNEIYEYIQEIEEVIEKNIIKKQDEVRGFEKNFEEESEKYNVLRSEVDKACKVIDDLWQVIGNDGDEGREDISVDKELEADRVISNLKEALGDDLLNAPIRNKTTYKSNTSKHLHSDKYREPIKDESSSNSGKLILIGIIVAAIIAYGYETGVVNFDFNKWWNKGSDLAVSGDNGGDIPYESIEDNGYAEEKYIEHYASKEDPIYSGYNAVEEDPVYYEANNGEVAQGAQVTNAYYNVYDGYTDFIITTGEAVEFEHKMANYGEGDVIFVDIKNAPLTINYGSTIKQDINSNGLLMFKVGKHDTMTRASVSIVSQRNYDVIYDEELKAVVLRIENRDY